MTSIEDQIAELDALAEKATTGEQHGSAWGFSDEQRAFREALVNAWSTWLREAALRGTTTTEHEGSVPVTYKEECEALCAIAGGWCGLKAEQDQMIATWDAMLAAAPATSQRDCVDAQRAAIYREAFIHIAMHMREDGPVACMPLSEWNDHYSIYAAFQQDKKDDDKPMFAAHPPARTLSEKEIREIACEAIQRDMTYEDAIRTALERLK